MTPLTNTEAQKTVVQEDNVKLKFDNSKDGNAIVTITRGKKQYTASLLTVDEDSLGLLEELQSAYS